jgi:isopentenyldiphosphate isomerase
MAIEYVYHVDENDEILAKVPRSEMREKVLLHRGTIIFTFNYKGEILIHKRTNTKDNYPGFLDVGHGGAVESKETYDENAIKETEEEIGIKNAKLEYLFKKKYIGKSNKTFCKVYRLIHEGPFKFQKEEVVWGKFISLDDLKELIKKEKFCPDGLEFLDEYLTNYHNK